MVRTALCGYGYWGPNLLRNLHEHPGASVVAVADLDPTRRQLALSRYPGLRLEADPGPLLRDPEVDALVIATPVQTHFELAKAALEQGKHVLVEKPLAGSVREVEKLLELARRQERTLMVNHTFCYHPAVQKIKTLIEEGSLGELYYLDSVRINLGLFQHDVNVLWDLAPHDLSIMDLVISERPKSISALGACHAGSQVESIAYLTVRFESGLLAHFHNNWLAPVKVRTMMIGGARRMLVYDDLQTTEKLKVYDRGVRSDSLDCREEQRRLQYSYRTGDMWSPHLEPEEALANVVAEFVDCCSSGRSPLADGEAGLRVVRLLEAADRSMARGGREIRL
jgi:predicted dehydrogenase